MQGTKVVRPFPFFRAGARASQPQLSKPILTLEDVSKFFRPDQPTLRSVNLSVERGEFVFITGPSGAGKSTLLKLVYREPVSYTHLTLPTTRQRCISRWSPYH